MYSLYGKRRPSLITYHSDIVRQKFLSWLYGPLMRHFLGSVQRVVATSPNYLATSDVLNGIQRDIDIVPIGLQRESYPSEEALGEEIEAARARYGAGFFLFVGVLRYYKGLHILLEAARNAAFNVVIVGIGPEKAALQRQAEKLGLDNVVFTGYLPDREKMALFHLCRAVVFPSYLRSEAFGVTLLEGAMSGRPLISAEVGSGSSHINLHEQTGLVVTPGSPRSLRDAMDTLHRDPALAATMGTAARRRFEELFTGREMGRRYASIYRQIMRGEHEAGSAAVGGVA
jgi:rhamnosyl/mannosyltransferase